MPEHHAVLSPSASERWIQCPASVRMASLIPKPAENVSSPYAREGTTAHTVAELAARCYVLSEITERQFKVRAGKAMKGISQADQEDMIRHGQEYAAHLLERMEAHPHSRLLLEQRLPTGIPDCWGTSDAVIVAVDVVEIWDYKYGLGIQVYAEDNPQLKLYGLGALEEYGDILGTTETVRIGIFQPRLDHTDHWDISAEDLRAWRDSIIPIAEEALGDNAHFAPSEEACRFCPAAGECRARMEAATSEDFGTDPDLLTAEEIADLLHKIPEIVNFCKAVEAVALRKAYSDGVPLPGWKVVLSGGRRYIVDQEAALEALHSAGFTTDQVAQVKLKGIGELEKLLGKDTFAAVLGTLSPKSPGNPSLVTEDDRRPAISPTIEAAKDFS